MKRVAWLLPLLVLVLLPGCERPLAAASALTDPSGLLDPGERARIEAWQERLLHDLDVELHVEVLATRSADPAAATLRRFEERAIGRRTRGARGVLLLIDPEGEAVRMEIGYDLEGLFPDAFVARIEREQMAPFFRASRVGPGVEATVELLVSRALESTAASDEPGVPAPKQLSGGAGARVPVAIGSGPDPKPPHAEARHFGPKPSPEAAFAAYRDVLARGVKDPELGLYTPETRRLLAARVLTDAQQDQELRALGSAGAPRVHRRGDLAVLRFEASEGRVPPYFLRRDPAGWRLDLASASRVIGFDARNRWFLRTRDSEYAFALGDD